MEFLAILLATYVAAVADTALRRCRGLSCHPQLVAAGGHRRDGRLVAVAVARRADGPCRTGLRFQFRRPCRRRHGELCAGGVRDRATARHIAAAGTARANAGFRAARGRDAPPCRAWQFAVRRGSIPSVPRLPGPWRQASIPPRSACRCGCSSRGLRESSAFARPRRTDRRCLGSVVALHCRLPGTFDRKAE